MSNEVFVTATLVITVFASFIFLIFIISIILIKITPDRQPTNTTQSKHITVTSDFANPRQILSSEKQSNIYKQSLLTDEQLYKAVTLYQAEADALDRNSLLATARQLKLELSNGEMPLIAKAIDDVSKLLYSQTGSNNYSKFINFIVDIVTVSVLKCDKTTSYCKRIAVLIEKILGKQLAHIIINNEHCLDSDVTFYALHDTVEEVAEAFFTNDCPDKTKTLFLDKFLYALASNQHDINQNQYHIKLETYELLNLFSALLFHIDNNSSDTKTTVSPSLIFNDSGLAKAIDVRATWLKKHGNLISQYVKVILSSIAYDISSCDNSELNISKSEIAELANTIIDIGTIVISFLLVEQESHQLELDASVKYFLDNKIREINSKTNPTASNIQDNNIDEIFANSPFYKRISKIRDTIRQDGQFLKNANHGLSIAPGSSPEELAGILYMNGYRTTDLHWVRGTARFYCGFNSDDQNRLINEIKKKEASDLVFYFIEDNAGFSAKDEALMYLYLKSTWAFSNNEITSIFETAKQQISSTHPEFTDSAESEEDDSAIIAELRNETVDATAIAAAIDDDDEIDDLLKDFDINDLPHKNEQEDNDLTQSRTTLVEENDISSNNEDNLIDYFDNQNDKESKVSITDIDNSNNDDDISVTNDNKSPIPHNEYNKLNDIAHPLRKLLRKEIDSHNLRFTDLKPNWSDYLDLLEQNGITKLYHFTAERNLRQIKKSEGLLSWYASEHQRVNVSVYGGDNLSRKLDRSFGNQDYVHLSFCDDHPMSYKLKQANESVIVLEINPIVAVLKDTLFSDINAADKNHRQGGELADLKRVNFEATKRHYVSRTDPDFKSHQAEVMVKTYVPTRYIYNLSDLLEQYDDTDDYYQSSYDPHDYWPRDLYAQYIEVKNSID